MTLYLKLWCVPSDGACWKHAAGTRQGKKFCYSYNFALDEKTNVPNINTVGLCLVTAQLAINRNMRTVM